MKEKQRVQFWDIARGIAIILMIVGHTLPREWWGVKIAYSFHMPLFVIASGYFFKENEKIGTVIKNVCLKLVLPSILGWTIIQWSFYEVLQLPISATVKIQTIVDKFLRGRACNIDTFWFFLFLAMIRVSFVLLYKVTRGRESIIGILCFFFFLIGYQLGEHQIILPLQMDLVLTCLFLYDVGHLLQKKQAFSKIERNKWILIILTIIWLSIAFLSEVDIAIAIYGKYGIGLFGAICGTIVICKISEKLEKIPAIRKISSFLWKEFNGHLNDPSV